jgi:hypothetical protein
MSDTTVSGMASCCAPDLTDLDRLAASLEALAAAFCKPETSAGRERRRRGRRRPHRSMDQHQHSDKVALVA